jgi:pilus assembly protein Flp/PilA
VGGVDTESFEERLEELSLKTYESTGTRENSLGKVLCGVLVMRIGCTVVGGTSSHTVQASINSIGKAWSMKFLENFFVDEAGQDLVEYSLLLGFVALAAGAILSTLGTDITAIYSTIDSSVNSAKSAIT